MHATSWNQIRGHNMESGYYFHFEKDDRCKMAYILFCLHLFSIFFFRYFVFFFYLFSFAFFFFNFLVFIYLFFVMYFFLKKNLF